MRLTPLVAGALSAAVFAGATVWIFASLSGLWVWGAFIGWASYDQSGANPRALFTSSTCMAFGVVMAWLVALVVAAGVVPLPTAATSALAAALAPSSSSRSPSTGLFERSGDLLWLCVGVRLLASFDFGVLDQRFDVADSGQRFDLHSGIASDRFVAGAPSSAIGFAHDCPGAASASARYPVDAAREGRLTERRQPHSIGASRLSKSPRRAFELTRNQNGGPRCASQGWSGRGEPRSCCRCCLLWRSSSLSNPISRVSPSFGTFVELVMTNYDSSARARSPNCDA